LSVEGGLYFPENPINIKQRISNGEFCFTGVKCYRVKPKEIFFDYRRNNLPAAVASFDLILPVKAKFIRKETE